MSEYKYQNIKLMSFDELYDIANNIRNDIIDAVSFSGGHLGSNLGIVELTLAIHYVFDLPTDKLLFDVGHQCYTHKLLSSRSLANLRMQNGISGFFKRDESPYDIFEAGHSSTSLSASLGMAISRDLNNEHYEVINVIGDASLASGPSLEALLNISRLNNKIIIVFNDNSFGLTFDYQTIIESLGLDYLGIIDGHNIEYIINALNTAKNNEKSVFIHFKTIKGKGYPFAEKDHEDNYHGVGPFNKETGELSILNNSWSGFYSSLVLDAMKNERFVYINPAMIKGFEAENILKTYPNRTFDVGICEEHAVSLASGFALNKKHPILALYSTFLQRSLDQINQDLCRMKLPSTILVDRAGFVGPDGETHQGIYDEGFLINNPNIIITMPSSRDNARAIFNLSLKSDIPFVIRYPRDEVVDSDLFNKLGKNEYWAYINNNHANLIIGVGPNFTKLSEKIIKEGLSYDLMNALFIKPIDKKYLKIALKYRKIVVYDSYATRFGLVNEILAYLANHKYNGDIIIKCIEDSFINQGTILEQLKTQKLDIESMLSFLKEESKC